MPNPSPVLPPIVNVIVGVAIGLAGLAADGRTAQPPPTVEPSARGLVLATWNVPEGDLARAKDVGISMIVAPVRDPAEVRPLLREAATLDLRVILFIRDPNDIESPAPPSQIGPYVRAARDQPALYGYLSAVEPAFHGLGLRELRQRYKAYKRLDPDAAVIASFSYLRAFGTSDNPWGAGVADIAWIEWYPVEARSGYRPGAGELLTHARATIEAATPGLPIWLVAQCHENARTGRRAPSVWQLERQVSDGRHYLEASGVVFYPWYVQTFGSDLSRNPRLQAVVRRLAGVVGGSP